MLSWPEPNRDRLTTFQLSYSEHSYFESLTGCLHFFRSFCPKRLIDIHTNIHTLMVVAAMQGADQHIRRTLGFSISPKNMSTCRPGELNQQPSDNKTLALALSHSQSCWISPIVANLPFTLNIEIDGRKSIRVWRVRTLNELLNLTSWEWECVLQTDDKKTIHTGSESHQKLGAIVNQKTE